MEPHQRVDNLIACHLCDGLFDKPKIEPGQEAMCPGCGTCLMTVKKNPIDRTIAIALAGLLLFLPAITLPIVGIGVAGLYNDSSLFECIELLINGEFYLIALCVFLSTIAIPVVRLVTALTVTWHIKTNNIKPSLLIFFRSYHLLDSWTMIHIFFLGVVVSMYKLVSLADLSVGGGFYSLLLLLVCSTLVSNTMDQQFVWQELEKVLGD